MGSIQSYTKAALDALLGGKSDVGHTHAGGGAPAGPVGVAKLTANSATFNGGPGGFVANDLTYGAIENPFPYSKPDMDLSWISMDPANPSRIKVIPGVYTAVLEFGLAWPSAESANAPTSIRPIIDHGGEGGNFASRWYPSIVDQGGTKGVQQVLHSPTVYSDGQFTSFQLQIAHTASGAYPTLGGAGQRRAMWQITKWY